MTNKQAAIKVIERLCNNGFQALLAGGCVRDMLLGRPANDYDVATNARPEQVVKLFKRTLKVGAKFGVIVVMTEGRHIEVATFRTEEGYTDGRHPEKIAFADAAEDSARRDFTINGMFFEPLDGRIIDYVNGRGDLKSRIIRTIGTASERFDEDYLRMLRAVRFSTQLKFSIEPQTWTAVCSNAGKITEISGERISIEIEAILANPNRTDGVKLLIESGLAEAIFPGFTVEQKKSASEILGHLPKKIDFTLGLAGFFSGCSTEFAVEKCKILKLSKNHIRHLKFLLNNRGTLLNRHMSLAELKMILAKPYFDDLYELQRAIQKGGGKTVAVLTALKKKIKALGDVELKPKPLLNGHELIDAGAVPGPQVGQLAQELYIAQLEGKVLTVEQAGRWVRRWLQKHRTEQ